MDHLAGIIWAVAGLLTLLGLGALVVKGLIKNFRVEAGPIKARVDLRDLHNDLKEMKSAVTQINDAVNHQREGDPTLVQRVSKIEDAVECAKAHQDAERAMFVWLATTIKRIAHHVGIVPDEEPAFPIRDQQEVSTQ